MLQWYADYMEALENGENVVHGTFGKSAKLYVWTVLIDSSDEVLITLPTKLLYRIWTYILHE